MVLDELHLPDAVVKHITGYLLAKDTPSQALATLVSLGGVSRHWRSVTSDVSPAQSLSFDSADTTVSSSRVFQQFKKLPVQHKQVVFLGAARLLKGFRDVTFSGDAVTDETIDAVAKNACSQLRKCRIHKCTQLTDAGLSAFMSRCPNLKEIHISDLPRRTTARFINVIFQTCTQLEVVTLANIEGLNWIEHIQSASWPVTKVSRLQLRGAMVDAGFATCLEKFPFVTEMQVHAPSHALAAASMSKVARLVCFVERREDMADAILACSHLPQLRSLELVIKNFTVAPEQLRHIGMLPLSELRVDSFQYKQQPTLSRAQYSHVDNDGVKALVDSVRLRYQQSPQGMCPLKLSLCGATALSHEAVSALLSLPLLAELDICGCCKITSMDKMRLIAKVKAGKELLEKNSSSVKRSAMSTLMF